MSLFKNTTLCSKTLMETVEPRTFESKDLLCYCLTLPKERLCEKAFSPSLAANLYIRVQNETHSYIVLGQQVEAIKTVSMDDW